MRIESLEKMPKDRLISKVMFIDEPERLNTIIVNIPESFWGIYTFVKSKEATIFQAYNQINNVFLKW